MKPVAWGVLSVSTHYQLRVHTYVVKSPLVDMRAVASRSKERAADFGRAFGIPKAYGSYEELVADKEIEAVYIPLPNHLHAEWVKKCADAGKHVLCEKPFALDAREAEDAIRHAEKKGVLVMEAFMYRFHPQWQRAREIVKAGELGEIRATQTLFTYMLKDPQNIRNILDMGGGGIPDIGCYAVSTARFMIGREPLRVVSLVERDPKLKTDILASGILDFGSARSTFTVGTQTFGWQKVDVIGSDGELRVHLPFNAFPDSPMKLTVTTGVGQRAVFTQAADQYQAMFDSFSRAVREGGAVPTPPQDAINNMKVLDALFRSEKSGTWEKV
ncbi:MAG TPA: Gfo/Idh/MocA family oxidoreductase [Spirochaetia bacterium]|nr:Gfo/Idh/MocA family oxidoreductase [Spirochaetia bacterium]